MATTHQEDNMNAPTAQTFQGPTVTDSASDKDSLADMDALYQEGDNPDSPDEADPPAEADCPDEDDLDDFSRAILRCLGVNDDGADDAGDSIYGSDSEAPVPASSLRGTSTASKSSSATPVLPLEAHQASANASAPTANVTIPGLGGPRKVLLPKSLKAKAEEQQRQKQLADAQKKIEDELKAAREAAEKQAEQAAVQHKLESEQLRATNQSLQGQLSELMDKYNRLEEETAANRLKMQAQYGAAVAQLQQERADVQSNLASAIQESLAIQKQEWEKERADLTAQYQGHLEEASSTIENLQSQVSTLSEKLHQKDHNVARSKETVQISLIEEIEKLKSSHDAEMASAKTELEALRRQLEQKPVYEKVVAQEANPSPILQQLQDELEQTKSMLTSERKFHERTCIDYYKLKGALKKAEGERQEAISASKAKQRELQKEIQDFNFEKDQLDPRVVPVRFRKADDFLALWQQEGPKNFVEIAQNGLSQLARFKGNNKVWISDFARSLELTVAHLSKAEHGIDSAVYFACQKAYEFHQQAMKSLFDNRTWIDETVFRTEFRAIKKLDDALVAEDLACEALIGPETELATLLERYHAKKVEINELESQAKSVWPVTWARRLGFKMASQLRAEEQLPQHFEEAREIREQAVELLAEAEKRRLAFGAAIKLVKPLFKNWAGEQVTHYEPKKNLVLEAAFEHKILPLWLQLRKTLEKFHQEFDLDFRPAHDNEHEVVDFILCSSAGQPPQDLLWQETLEDLNDLNARNGIPRWEHVVGSHYAQIGQVRVPEVNLPKLILPTPQDKLVHPDGIPRRGASETNVPVKAHVFNAQVVFVFGVLGLIGTISLLPDLVGVIPVIHDRWLAQMQPAPLY